MSRTETIKPNIENQNVDDLVKSIIGEIPKTEYAEVKLPSLGTEIYGLDTPYVHIRPMTFADEKAIISAKKGAGMNILLSRCIEENLDPKLLLLQDKLALLFQLRAISIGNKYDFKMTCSECEATTEVAVDVLETFPCRYAEEPVKSLVALKLPESGKEVVLRRAPSYELEDDNLRVVNELWRYMVEIEGISHPKVRAEVIEYLPRKDIYFMIEQITLPNLGIDQKFLFRCSRCGHESEEELKLTPDFFSLK